MARENLTFLVNLRKNEVSTSKTYGQYYPEAEPRVPLSLKGFARHLADHGKLATYDMLVLVLQNVVSCMKELASQGQPVKLDGLGTFSPSIEGVGADSVEEAVQSLDQNIKGVHLRFLPEGAKGDELTSRQLKKACHFEAYQLVKTMYKVVDGKKKAYQVRTPLSTYALSQAEPDPEPEP
jgi:hypothetical protein